MKLGLMGVAFLCTLCTLAATAFADAPGWSRGQQELAISWEECVKRAGAGLAAEGYRIDQPSPFAVGIKGVHTALIMCNPAPGGKTWVNIVVASNGEGGGGERQRLQARMEATAPPPPPPPPPTTREGCQGADWSVRLSASTVQRNQNVTVHFVSRGRVNERDWISIYRAGTTPDKHIGLWRYASHETKTCSWTFSVSEPGQYGVAYLLSDGTEWKATTPLTVTGDTGAQQRVEPPPPPPPAPPAAPRYLGCFKDTAAFDLDGHLERSRSNTPQRCIQICGDKGFVYAGVQYSESCLCGNRYGKYGAADNCNMPCTGDRNQTCGGANANGVYTTGR